MDKDKISKNTWAALCLTVLLSVFGGWSSGNERQNEAIRKISVMEEKCAKTDARYEEIIQKLDELGADVSEVKSDVKLLNATKADRKYVE